jgi:hypothetical protein
MSDTPAAWLARLKVAFPHWSIRRVPPATGTGFTASRGLPDGRSQSLYAPTLAELEYELWIAARAGQLAPARTPTVTPCGTAGSITLVGGVKLTPLGSARWRC